MSRARRHEILKFVPALLMVLSVVACQQLPEPKSAKADPQSRRNKQQAPTANDIYWPPTKLANLEDRAIDESSGLIASRTSPGTYWTHNDSGNGPVIYAFDSNGRRRGSWRVTGAASVDWEDMAAGPGPKPGASYLYIGDIGDNSGRRSEIIVYRVPEPSIPNSASEAAVSELRATEPAEAIRLRYPDGKHNSEALLVHPHTGKIYIVIKVAVVNPGVYAADSRTTAETITLARVGEVDMPGFLGGIITGGAISPDGRRAALCDYIQGYEVVLPEGSSSFDSIWKQPLRTVDLGERKHGEAISYRLDSKALLATSERLPAPLIQVVRR